MGEGTAAGAAAASAAAVALVLGAAPANAGGGPQIVGEFGGQGLVIKDTIQVVRVPDPSVEGVTVYLSQSNQALSLSQSNNTALGCAITGPVSFSGDLGGKKGEEIVREGRGVFGTKSIHVRRVYDAPQRTLTYVAYNTRLAGDDDNKSRFKTALCTVVLPEEEQAPATDA
eukprot:PRCOL_00003538-RA